MSKLRIAADYSLPLKFLEVRKVVYGGSGAGKTASGRMLFEEATAAGVCCGAIDLKGDWWGLKSTADGQDDGIPVVIFGGDHQDIPLDENGGAPLADIVVDLRQPFIIDLEHLSKGKQMRFLSAFLERLYDRNRDPLVLFLDEADRYASQKPMTPEAHICLGACEDIAKRGRKHGIFPVFITQRNASINKGVSELCEVAMVFRTTGPRDQDAVADWFGTNATKEQRDAVIPTLSRLPTGTAIVCSAYPGLEIFETIPLRLPRTFDSSATPEIGRRRIEPKRLATPDLEKLQTRMAATIERAKADDPKALRARIVELERDLKGRAGVVVHAAPKVVEKTVERRMLKDGDLRRLEVDLNALKARCEVIKVVSEKLEIIAGRTFESAAMLARRMEEVLKVQAAPPLALPPSTGASTFPTQRLEFRAASRAAMAAPADGLTAPQQAILDTVAMLGVRGITPERDTVARWLGIHPNGGSYGANLGHLRANGYLDGFRLTEKGQSAARAQETGLEAALKAVDGEPQRNILRALLDAGKPLAREELAERLGLHPNGGSYGANLGWLRTMRLITERGPITVTEALHR